MLQEKDIVVVVFSKAQVRHCKTAHFLKQFGRDALPEGPDLASMMGKFEFLVEGYDDDPQEIYGIPEVRKFYQHLHRVWPYWFFFCDLGSQTLTMMTMCLMPKFSGFKRLGAPSASVEIDSTDLLNFIRSNFGPLNLVMERAGMSERDIYNRTRDVFHHYKLPYDVEPPEED
jgi:hypothetical protein